MSLEYNQITKQISEVTRQWPVYAEQTRVESKKRDAVMNVLLTAVEKYQPFRISLIIIRISISPLVHVRST